MNPNNTPPTQQRRSVSEYFSDRIIGANLRPADQFIVSKSRLGFKARTYLDSGSKARTAYIAMNIIGLIPPLIFGVMILGFVLFGEKNDLGLLIFGAAVGLLFLGMVLYQQSGLRWMLKNRNAPRPGADKPGSYTPDLLS